jgi:hypothetical protein
MLPRILVTCCLVLTLFLVLPVQSRAEEGGWVGLTGDAATLKFWRGPLDDWVVAGEAAVDPKNPRRLTSKPGEGILAPKSGNRARNLVTRAKYTDVELHVEFFIPKGSNSGVKLMGLYEIQILDSHGVKDLSGAHCGGIYPRAEQEPTYHHIDKGVAPRVNAARPAGEWQSLDIVFHAPRFDAEGKKKTNARFVKVGLNGRVIHQDIEVASPTGSAWRLMKEVPEGPLLLQADHGPVAFRNVRIRPLKAAR